jgi:NADH-quinone oxidoreductase subunit F
MKPLKSVEELLNLREQVHKKVAEQEKQTQVRVHLGTCGISSGASKILDAFQHEVKARKLSNTAILKAGCIGLCGREPIVTISQPGNGRVIYADLTVDKIPQIVDQHLIEGKVIKEWMLDLEAPLFKLQEIRIMHNQDLDPMSIEEYIARDGYQALAKALTKMQPDEVVEEVKKAGLRGRGGAGFPTATKWGLVRSAVGDEKYVVCNGDEGDPGAYMNRAVLEGNPHSIIEGMAIGAYAIGNVRQGYAYVRAEYPLAIETLNHAITQAREYSLIGKNILGTGFEFDLDIFPGAGAFVCGEETALLISIEGKRGNPRQRPPFPANKGLFDKPTTLNNVETWSNIPQIIWKGAEWFSSVGTERSKGTKTLCLVGKINNTGLVEVPLGTSLGKIVFDIGGGIPDNKKFKAVQIGGPSGGVIPLEHINTPVDYEAVTALGAIMGSGGLVVMDEDSCMVDVAKFFLQFTRDESCGKCTPCRAGIPKMLELLTKITDGKGTMDDLTTLEELAEMVGSASICGLGQTAPNPVLTTLRHFRQEYEAHIMDKKCPAAVCQALFPSPCQHTCPVGINIPKYIAHIADGEYLEAIETIRERNPFPAICGRICHHPCEYKCRRKDIDTAMAIRSLKRFAADWYFDHLDKLPLPQPFTRTKSQKVAVVGAGPTGLSCAYFLAQMGYGVTVFEALPVGGGMLAIAIPEFRLPRKVIQQEIDYIAKRGVEILYNTPINENFRIRQLLQSGYSAAFIAAGAQKSQRIGIPGEVEGLEGLYYGLIFLRDIKIGRQIRIGHRVAVIGGGNVAIDAARSAIRLGAEEVNIYYRRTRDEMLATEVEYDGAVAEGVRMNFLVSPLRIVSENWRITGLQCTRMQLSDIDASGRRRPVPIPGSEFFVAADTIIAAVGQAPDLSFLPPDSRLERTEWERLVFDPNTLSTNIPGIFAGGDFVRGPDMVIYAIADGKRAAIAIDKYLKGDTSRVELYELKPKAIMESIGYGETEELWKEKPRLEVPMLPAEERKRSFEEIELPFTEEEARREAKRCLRCDLEVGE